MSSSRVTITYKDPLGSEKDVELPFVTGVMADLSGNNPGKEKEGLRDRDIKELIPSQINSFMNEVKPGLAMEVENALQEGDDKLGVALKFESMEDFTPTRIAEQVPALSELLEMRRNIDNLRRLLIVKPAAKAEIKKLLNDPVLLKVMAEQAESKAQEDEA